VDIFRLLMRETQLSGGQIAVKTGLSRSHISDVLRGWKAPSPDAAGKIAVALGAGKDDIRKVMRLAEELLELNRHHRRNARYVREPSSAQRSSVSARAPDPATRPGRSWPGEAEYPAVSWPYRIGVVPLRAQCLQHRAEEAALLGELAQPTVGDRFRPVTQILAGLGGVGKTQLAAESAEMLFAAGQIDLLVWVSAASRAEIEACLAQAGFEVTGMADADAAEGARRFLAWLAATERTWLVVLDDLCMPADLSGLWPPARRCGQTLITTRRRDASLTGPDRHLIEVGPFSAAEATAYLSARLAERPELREGAEALAADLGFLPLALAQAAAYLLDRDLTCAQYRVRFADRSLKLAFLLPERQALPDAHTQTVATTWSLSVELADGLDPCGIARPLLELAAVVDPNGIPAEVFGAAGARGYLAKARSAAPTSEPPRSGQDFPRDGLRCLARLSLLTVDQKLDASVVRVHTLVQRAVRDLIVPGQLRPVVRAVADALAEVWPTLPDDPGRAAMLRANTEAITAVDHDALWTPRAHPVLFRAGESTGVFCGPAEAIEYFQRLDDTAKRLLGPDHPDAMTARHELALWLGQGGNASGAAAQYEGLLADRLRLLGPDHPDTLMTRGNLALWHGKADDPGRARAEFAALLFDLIRVLGPEHPHTLAARHNLAYWHGQAGDAAGAAAGFSALLADLTEIVGPDHADTLNARNSLAWWLGEAGDPAAAARTYESLLSDRLRVHGADRRMTMVTRHNLAYWRGRAGDPAGAAAAYASLLDDRRRMLGAEHPHTLNARSEMARWRGESGDHAGAVQALAELLTDRIRLRGPDDLDTLITRHNIARWRAKAGDPAGALAALRALLTDQLRVLGGDHPEVAATHEAITQLSAVAG
jgi:hypothetical protein